MKPGLKKDKIKNIGKVFSGATPRTNNHEFWDGDILWITPYDLSKITTQYFSDTDRKITIQGLNSCSAHLLPKGSLVISSRAPIGYLALSTRDFTTNQGCKSIVFYDSYDSLFFYYNFQNQVTTLKRLGEGTTFAEISKNYLEEFEVFFPESKLEQIKIASILATTDSAIQQTEKVIAKYKRIKAGLMQDLLTRGIDKKGNIRKKSTHKFTVKNGIEVPDEWMVITVEEFATSAKYAIVDGPFGSNLKIIHYKTAGIPIIQSGFVTSQKFEANEYIYVDKEKFEQEKRSKASPGDLIMAKIGANCGTCALLPENHPISILAGNTLKITVGFSNHNRYLEVLFHFFYSIGKFEDIKSTTAQPAISMASLKKMFIPRPSRDEQLKICEKINAIEETIIVETRYLHKLNSLKVGLMNDLLTGKSGEIGIYGEEH